ncbi:protein LTV1 homolog [Leguminivora glycinivorella]|uniref:protein LTV1 homolog n=1 Tax=Leguminivora glycinivorella TaxID=1035111 RepID=UPI00200CA688|nr:protein LTV1 homolog [Leguminivora glycinivorella]
MPKTKKKFIDRKKAVTFNLVHRSQRDPLAADESAPQRVLVPVSAAVPPRKEKEPELTPEQRREEQRKYGVYFDDDYNYLQHLKDTKEVTLVLQPKATHKRKEKSQPSGEEDEPVIPVVEKLNLPSSVFASAVEEDVGLLNKAATQGLCLDLDPEVVAALDEDFDFEDPQNELEDNFIELAMGEGADDGEEYEEDDEDADSVSGDSGQAFASDLDSDDDTDPQEGRRLAAWDSDKHDTKSRFSQYSMSSSVIRRNQGLTLLDDRFEKMFAEYDDTELGALECEEIEGFMPESHAALLRAADEFEESRRRHQLDKEREIARIRRLQEIEEESEEELDTVEVPREEKWDCETILSTYSNLYNHPKLIEEPKKPGKIRINPKTGIPKDVLEADNKLTVKSLARFNALQPPAAADDDDDAATRADTVLSTLSVLSLRPKDESPEEKKERKRLLKEFRAERRAEKKANREAFKQEKMRQEKILLNNRNNVQGNRIL